MLDYRKFTGSRDLRQRILSNLSWVPDKLMLRIQYFLQTGRWLNLKNPRRFTEKIQWYKLYYRDPAMLRCTDKKEVREYVREKGLGDILIPLYATFGNVEEVDLDKLPTQFVAKTTDGGGSHEIMVCKNKDEIPRDIFISKINNWLSQPKPRKHIAREWAYDNGIPRRIIIEKLLDSQDNYSLIDYKFFCFDGKVKYIYAISERKIGTSAKLGIYDENFTKLNVDRVDEGHQERSLPKPENFERMKDIARVLANGFPHVRVDLYNVNGKIYFGELTFYDGSGYMGFNPDSFDYELGKCFDLTNLKGSRKNRKC